MHGLGGSRGRRRDRPAALVGDRLAGREPERQLARPRRQRVVLGGVDRRAGADLRGRLVERQRDDLGRLQLLVARPADVVGATAADVVDDRPQRLELLVASSTARPWPSTTTER